MLEKEYSILGVDKNASDEELEKAYYDKKERLEEDRFLDGEAGNEAARQLTELKSAYAEIKNYRNEHANKSSEGLYKDIDEAIKSGDLDRAQQLLDGFNERPAEWHYLQSVVFYKKNWINDSKKQLEIAKNLDPTNEKYKKAYDRMMEKIKSDEKTKSDYSSRSGLGAYEEDSYSGGRGERQMGGDGCMESCCQILACNMCLNLLCNCR